MVVTGGVAALTEQFGAADTRMNNIKPVDPKYSTLNDLSDGAVYRDYVDMIPTQHLSEHALSVVATELLHRPELGEAVVDEVARATTTSSRDTTKTGVAPPLRPLLVQPSMS